MYRLVVVDDEKTIRQGMCKFIDWNRLGFEVIADFEDGKETIEFLQENTVDVILADIQMSEKSGLDVAAFVQEQNLPVKVVIISSFREFEYARRAVELNVEHYLLKPIQLPEVESVFTKIKEDLDKRVAEPKETTTEANNFDEILPELQEEFLVSLLVGVTHEKVVLEKKLKLLKLPFQASNPYAVLNVTIRNEESLAKYGEISFKKNLLRNMFEEDTNIIFYIVGLSKDTIKIIATVKRERKNLEEDLQQYIHNKTEDIKRLLDLDLDISIENIYPDIWGFEERKYTLSKEPKNLEPMQGKDYDQVLQKYRLLCYLINSGDFSELKPLLDNIFFGYRNLPLDQVKHIIINMFSLLSNKYMKMGSEEWKTITMLLLNEKLYETDSREELMEKCMSILNKTIQTKQTQKSETAQKIIEQAVDYMKEHYAQSLSLEMISDKYFLNQCYFSRIFKQYKGETFTDYLIQIRMEKAKELLAEGKYKVYEISEMVGYVSEKYFFRIFKQYTGKSPSEYQRSLILREDYHG